MTAPLQVLLVEDDWTVRSALTDYLIKREFQVVTADTYESAVAVAVTTAFAAAIVDIVLPRRKGERAAFRDNTGLEVARELRRLQPNVGIIFLSAYVDRGPEVVQLYMEGHENIVYLAKGSKPSELSAALQKVTQGGSALELGSGITRLRATAFDAAWQTLTPAEQEVLAPALGCLETLSDAERQVLAALGACLNRHEVAARLNVTAKTVDYHISHLYDKLLLHGAPAGCSPSALLVKIHLLAQLQQAQR